MRALRLTETCVQYTTTRNRYGDLVLQAGATIPCLFRDISVLQRNVLYKEDVMMVGILWLDPATTVQQGDVVKIASTGKFYRIEEVTVARSRLSNDAVHFIKCSVSLARQIS